jgi:ABC-type nitrate/sulfonate/bicarbonate transport system substrate-binding protein
MHIARRLMTVAAGIVLAAAPRTIAAAAEGTTVTVISYPARPPKLPLWLARDAGLFEKNGLKVNIQELASNEELVQALQKNDGRVYAATANWIVSAIGDGLDVRFVLNTGYSVLKFLARPSISTAQELKGKKIGSGEPNSSQDRITRETLRRLGLNADSEVTLVPFGGRSVARLNALLRGEIDATTSNEDNLFDLERRGDISKVRVLADNETLKLFIGAGVDFAFSRAWLDNSRAAAKAFVRSICEAIALARRDRAQAERIYTRYLDIHDPALLDFMYRTYVLTAIPQRPYPKTENVALGVQEFAAKPGLAGRTANDLIDASLVTELADEGLFEKLYPAAK